jgi:prolyl-tRNA synthetase
MTHADDDGMIMPPRLAPSQIAILPIIRNPEDEESILEYCNQIAASLRSQTYHGKAINAIVDKRDINTGEKSWGWVKKGIPVILEVGPRDMGSNSVFVYRRDKSRKERYGQDKVEFANGITNLLDDIQTSLLERARKLLSDNTKEIDNWDDFKTFFTPQNKKRPEIHGGFAMSHWCDSEECEAKINTELAVTIRCIPFNRTKSGDGKCIICGKPSTGRVIFAKSY